MHEQSPHGENNLLVYSAIYCLTHNTFRHHILVNIGDQEIFFDHLKCSKLMASYPKTYRMEMTDAEEDRDLPDLLNIISRRTLTTASLKLKWQILIHRIQQEYIHYFPDLELVTSD